MPESSKIGWEVGDDDDSEGGGTEGGFEGGEGDCACWMVGLDGKGRGID